jgi:nucleoside-diphosphate-sugar epimerase
VLVTGGAGFVGSHTARTLLQRGHRVVVVDEMNDYYDPALKMDNLTWLARTAPDRFVFVRGDICDRNLMERLIVEHQVNGIIHLAARAGVRSSIDNPGK